jgi:hypothetical protein
MMRFYLLPILMTATSRGAKYIKWRDNPDGIPVSSWGLMDYGFEPVCVFAGEMTDEQHIELSAYPDVYALPIDLDMLVGEEATALKTAFEAFNFPANWITPSISYRQVLRRIAASCQCLQRLKGMIGNYCPFSLGGQWGDHLLSTKLADIPLAVRGALLSACGQIGIESLNESTTLRGLINRYAWEWRTPILLGGIEI